jgi:excisionase family DNA binding protein
MATGKRRMTTGETARYIGISQTYVNTLIKSGKLTGERTTLGFYVDVDSADAFMREREARKRAKQRGTPDDTADDGLVLAVSA